MSTEASAGSTGSPAIDPTQRRRARRMLVLLFVVCAAPAVAAYLMYYVFKPQGGTSAYGKLIEPQRPLPALTVRDDETGETLPLSSLKGKWLMISADTAACDENCVSKLFYMRQIRVLQGNERTRVETLWLVTDDAPVSDRLDAAYEDTRRLRTDPVALASWLPTQDGTGLRDHIYLVDPLGNLMMAFPKHADPGKIKSDLSRLLKWSGTG
ncbi:SCO family protein [Pandoraea apista]|uniref:Cytochrome C oxidase subunit I n=1 Tax=Pandoraea apista TaxID=93218 RepID=A0A0G4JGE2_9BURK|nr:cytochrome c oxidase subunit I [Pandoraea apista]ALS65833.1 cytochrome C oxidase subunit I [Pandoraea apista]AVF39297.1 cytochrome C oxidase subunit I [Pandoraea apista]OXS95631.1 cytochrome C oxidase subunit I [Pandoraea apista]PTE01598.1 cytochrome C oxidase subunit I [Pandoraea apista]RRJ32237.1 cytochrome C oxidase subunit I [Pandoraea apista]